MGARYITYHTKPLVFNVPGVGLEPTRAVKGSRDFKSRMSTIPSPRHAPRMVREMLEATAGIAPAYNSFAENRLTTWLRGLCTKVVRFYCSAPSLFMKVALFIKLDQFLAGANFWSSLLGS